VIGVVLGVRLLVAVVLAVAGAAKFFDLSGGIAGHFVCA
jgi:hypothetical protein